MSASACCCDKPGSRCRGCCCWSVGLEEGAAPCGHLCMPGMCLSVHFLCVCLCVCVPFCVHVCAPAPHVPDSLLLCCTCVCLTQSGHSSLACSRTLNTVPLPGLAWAFPEDSSRDAGVPSACSAAALLSTRCLGGVLLGGGPCGVPPLASAWPSSSSWPSWAAAVPVGLDSSFCSGCWFLRTQESHWASISVVVQD